MEQKLLSYAIFYHIKIKNWITISKCDGIQNFIRGHPANFDFVNQMLLDEDGRVLLLRNKSSTDQSLQTPSLFGAKVQYQI